MEKIEQLSDQHLNAYLAKVNDRIRELMKEVNECQKIATKILCVKEERAIKKSKDSQLDMFAK